MITAIVDSQHEYFDYYNELSKKFDLKKGFDESESFIKIIAQDVLSRMNKLESSTESKVLALINLLSTKANKNDFVKFASIENKKSKGGIRTISVPEQDIDEHLLMWSNMYGVMLISREPIYHDRTSKIEGDFLIAFDTIPPFILLTNTENPEGNFKIIHDSGDHEKDEHLSEILAEFSRMITNMNSLL
jgi:hypothetical protein